MLARDEKERRFPGHAGFALGLVPLPSKWVIEFGEPIDVEGLGAAAAEDPMLVFEVTDQVGLIDGVSPLVEPLPKAYSFSITGPGAPAAGDTGFTASLNETTGLLSITNSKQGFVFKSGWKLTITAPLRFRPGLSPDTTVTNSITATGALSP